MNHGKRLVKHQGAIGTLQLHCVKYKTLPQILIINSKCIWHCSEEERMGQTFLRPCLSLWLAALCLNGAVGRAPGVALLFLLLPRVPERGSGEQKAIPKLSCHPHSNTGSVFPLATASLLAEWNSRREQTDLVLLTPLSADDREEEKCPGQINTINSVCAKIPTACSCCDLRVLSESTVCPLHQLHDYSNTAWSQNNMWTNERLLLDDVYNNMHVSNLKFSL